MEKKIVDRLIDSLRTNRFLLQGEKHFSPSKAST